MKKFLLFAVCGLIVWLIGFSIFAHRINHYPTDNETKTEAIIVLTGGRYRIAEAVRLMKDGMADKLFISGVEKNTSLTEIYKKQSIDFLDDANIALDRESKNTVENAVFSGNWLKDNNIKTIRLVTSNYHLPRSLAEFKYRCPNLKIIPHPVFSKYVAKEWWKSGKSFYLIASEYNKYLYVLLFRRLTKKD